MIDAMTPQPTPEQVSDLLAAYPGYHYANGLLWANERVTDPTAPKRETVIITQYWPGQYLGGSHE